MRQAAGFTVFAGVVFIVIAFLTLSAFPLNIPIGVMGGVLLGTGISMHR